MIYLGKLFIWAGNRDQADSFARRNDIPPQQYVHINSARRLELSGYADGLVIKVGTWYEDKEAHLFEQLLRAYGFTVVLED